MFERYTELARRTIFFARFEASRFGSSEIGTEHLLLGLIREEKTLPVRGGIEKLRSAMESQMPQGSGRTSTSIDMPLTLEAKRTLAYAAEESEALGHKLIDTCHLVLGLLRVKSCPAAVLLREHGLDLESYRKIARPRDPSPAAAAHERPVDRLSEWEQKRVSAAASSLQPATAALTGLLEQAINHLETSGEDYGNHKLKRKDWSRKQALGHLIDLATAHHHWLARALTEPKLTAPGYPSDDWVAAQSYENAPWSDLVDLWVGLNRLLIHVIAVVPEEKAKTPCRIGIQQPIPLSAVIERYVRDCEDLIGQIVAHLWRPDLIE